MNRLEKSIKDWSDAGFSSKVVDAPKDAFSFDKMLIVYSDRTKGTIRRVAFYDSRTDRVVREY